MPTAKGKHRIYSVAVFVVLEVAALSMLSAGSSVRQLWLGRMFTNMKASIWSTVDGIDNYFDLKEENDRLSAENAALMQALTSNGDYGSSDPARFTRSNYTIIPAHIVTMTTRSQHNYLIIDRGAVDGIEPDDGIITTNGVIGIVSGVARHYSYAVSFANKEMIVSVRAGREGTVGSMTWTGKRSNEAILSDIPIHTEIAEGDTVSTSGFSSIFPPDIPVGRVTARKGDNGSTTDYLVEMFSDFKNLHHVMVVKNPDRQEINCLIDEQN